MAKPRLDYTPPTQPKIKVGSTPVKKHWRFSLRFWQQIELFGLDKAKPSWFVSMLDKLADCSKEELDVFLTDSKKRDAYRFHEINWNQEGIPIKRSDLSWIGKAYLTNNEEFPFYQLQISGALGRIIGFFDELSVFNIVLLDHLHNAQPTKYSGYKVNPCSPLPNDFAVLVTTVQRIANVNWCKDEKCGMKIALNEIYHAVVEPGVVIMNLPDELYQKVSVLMQSEGIARLEEFFQYGIMFFEEQIEQEGDVLP